MHLAAAANLLTPAYLTLLSKGYSVHPEGQFVVAVRGADRFMAEDPITLVGVVVIAEARGEEWQATDEEIEDYLARFE